MKQIQTAYDVHEHVFLQFGESITESAVSKVREEKIPYEIIIEVREERNKERKKN